MTTGDPAMREHYRDRSTGPSGPADHTLVPRWKRGSADPLALHLPERSPPGRSTGRPPRPTWPHPRRWAAGAARSAISSTTRSARAARSGARAPRRGPSLTRANPCGGARPARRRHPRRRAPARGAPRPGARRVSGANYRLAWFGLSVRLIAPERGRVLPRARPAASHVHDARPDGESIVAAAPMFLGHSGRRAGSRWSTGVGLERGVPLVAGPPIELSPRRRLPTSPGPSLPARLSFGRAGRTPRVQALPVGAGPTSTRERAGLLPAPLDDVRRQVVGLQPARLVLRPAPRGRSLGRRAGSHTGRPAGTDGHPVGSPATPGRTKVGLLDRRTPSRRSVRGRRPSRAAFDHYPLTLARRCSRGPPRGRRLVVLRPQPAIADRAPTARPGRAATGPADLPGATPPPRATAWYTTRPSGARAHERGTASPQALPRRGGHRGGRPPRPDRAETGPHRHGPARYVARRSCAATRTRQPARSQFPRVRAGRRSVTRRR